VVADDYPIGIPAQVAEALLAQMDQSGALRPWRRWWRPAEPATSGFAVGWGSWFAISPSTSPRRLVELPGANPTQVWETPEPALDHIEAFLTGVHRITAPTRILATVLFTDIVDSTGRASRMGDRRWRELLEVHDELARRPVEAFGGQLIKTTGDGMLATFGPGRAIRCAAALRHELGGIGVQIRAGLHTGEVELRGGDVGGIAVHIAARVMAAANPGTS
jgi:hypothetical protein